MKSMLLLAIFSTLCFSALCQEQPRTTYLIARFQPRYNYIAETHYYYISAEAGTPDAPEVYGLKSFGPRWKDTNSGGSFYKQENDTATVLYNYFISHTAALHYLESRGWNLITIIPETYTEERRVTPGNGDAIIPVASSRPVYYFKKALP